MKSSHGCLNFPKCVHFNGPYYHYVLAYISKSFLPTLREVCDTGSRIYIQKFKKMTITCINQYFINPSLRVIPQHLQHLLSSLSFRDSWADSTSLRLSLAAVPGCRGSNRRLMLTKMH